MDFSGLNVVNKLAGTVSAFRCGDDASAAGHPRAAGSA